jgi:hypothetical protein
VLSSDRLPSSTSRSATAGSPSPSTRCFSADALRAPGRLRRRLRRPQRDDDLAEGLGAVAVGEVGGEGGADRVAIVLAHPRGQPAQPEAGEDRGGPGGAGAGPPAFVEPGPGRGRKALDHRPAGLGPRALERGVEIEAVEDPAVVAARMPPHRCQVGRAADPADAGGEELALAVAGPPTIGAARRGQSTATKVGRCARSQATTSSGLAPLASRLASGDRALRQPPG